MYKNFLLLVCLGFVFIYIRCEECDKLGILLYEDLGCKPRNSRGKPCPTHYECAEFTKSTETCLFQSEQIAIGGSVNDSLIYSSCKIGCHCGLNEAKNVTEFDCAVLDCPEWLGDLKGPDCYLTYTLGECCATGHKCPPFNNTTKCVVDGQEYKEGETFNPSNTCFSCVCQAGFDGKFEAPFCKRIACAVQVDSTDKLIENCAPVYFGHETLCCPSEWACSSNTDQIKQVGPKVGLSSNLTCKWGKHVLKLGEGLESKIEHFDEMKDITCECILPPLLTCKETKK